MGFLAAIGCLGIGPRLLECRQAGPRKLNVKFEPEVGFQGGVAQLVDFRIGQGIVLALGGTSAG